MPKNALFFQIKRIVKIAKFWGLCPQILPLAVLNWFQMFENSKVQIGPRSNKLKKITVGRTFSA